MMLMKKPAWKRHVDVNFQANVKESNMGKHSFCFIITPDTEMYISLTVDKTVLNNLIHI